MKRYLLALSVVVLCVSAGCDEDEQTYCEADTWVCLNNDVARCSSGSFVVAQKCGGGLPVCDISTQSCVTEKTECKNSCRSGLLTVCGENDTVKVTKCSDKGQVCGYDKPTETYSCVVASVQCDINKEIYVVNEQRCACNANSHWVGETGSCECDAGNGYVAFEKEGRTECVKKAVCNVSEKYDVATNSCVCNEEEGWHGEHGKCVCETCKDMTCLPGYHVSSKGCQKDTPSNCGEEGRSCGKVVKGWVSGKCVEKECIADECEDSYHPNKTECEMDSLDHCGAHDYKCETKMAGWVSGKCRSGACHASKCEEDYHIFRGQCIKDSVDACGSQENNCVKTVPGWVSGDCYKSKCVAAECLLGMHPSDTGVCAFDTAEYCGKENVACATMVAHWKAGTCVQGECYAMECETGFHTADGECEADSNECCGSSCAYCEGRYTCVHGKCQTNQFKFLDDTHFEFGHYEQDNNVSNGQEPIVWRILEEEDTKYLIVSEYGLVAKPYNETDDIVTWEDSTLRSWLNRFAETENKAHLSYATNNFIDRAFTTEEDSLILWTQHNELVDMRDRVFLLTADDISKYFSEGENLLDGKDRILIASKTLTAGGDGISCGTDLRDLNTEPICDFAKSSFAYTCSEECLSGKNAYQGKYDSCGGLTCGDWWLRNPMGGTEGNYVNQSGLVNQKASYKTDLMVRPAMWVSIGNK